MQRWFRRTMPLALVILVTAGGLAACQPDRGDPIRISRDFIVAIWTGNTEQARKLSCQDTRWSITGDPTLTVDLDHAHFEVTSQTRDRVEVTLSGVVTFKAPDGQVEVRDLNSAGATVFILEDQNGWKVCDVR